MINLEPDDMCSEINEHNNVSKLIGITKVSYIPEQSSLDNSKIYTLTKVESDVVMMPNYLSNNDNEDISLNNDMFIINRILSETNVISCENNNSIDPVIEEISSDENDFNKYVVDASKKLSNTSSSMSNESREEDDYNIDEKFIVTKNNQWSFLQTSMKKNLSMTKDILSTDDQRSFLRTSMKNNLLTIQDILPMNDQFIKDINITTISSLTENKKDNNNITTISSFTENKKDKDIYLSINNDNSNSTCSNIPINEAPNYTMQMSQIDNISVESLDDNFQNKLVDDNLQNKKVGNKNFLIMAEKIGLYLDLSRYENVLFNIE